MTAFMRYVFLVLCLWGGAAAAQAPTQAGATAPKILAFGDSLSAAYGIQASQGWGAWPACTARLGIR